MKKLLIVCDSQDKISEVFEFLTKRFSFDFSRRWKDEFKLISEEVEVKCILENIAQLRGAGCTQAIYLGNREDIVEMLDICLHRGSYWR